MRTMKARPCSRYDCTRAEPTVRSSLHSCPARSTIWPYRSVAWAPLWSAPMAEVHARTLMTISGAMTNFTRPLPAPTREPSSPRELKPVAFAGLQPTASSASSVDARSCGHWMILLYDPLMILLYGTASR